MRIFAAKLNEGTARFPQLVVINGENTDYDTDRNDNIQTLYGLKRTG